LAEVAGQVACALCTHQRCVLRLKTKRLDNFYRKRRNDPDFSEEAETFLARIRGVDVAEDPNYSSEADEDSGYSSR
jgi:hypothetical protein